MDHLIPTRRSVSLAVAAAMAISLWTRTARSADAAVVQIPVANRAEIYQAQLAVSDTAVAVITPDYPSLPASNPASVRLALFSVTHDGLLHALPGHTREGDWHTSLALDHAELLVGLAGSDSPGRHTDLMISERGTAPWAQDLSTAHAGKVLRFTIDSHGASDPTAYGSPTPRSYETFGAAIAWSANRIAIGAPGLDATGSVYLFKRGDLSNTATLTLHSAATDLGFGAAVALTEQELIVAASNQHLERRLNCFLLASDLSAGSRYEITNPVPGSPVAFGSALSVDGTHLLVTSYGFGRTDGGSSLAAAVDFYDRTAQQPWAFKQRLDLSVGYGHSDRSPGATVAALAGGRAYVLSEEGVREWMETDGGRWVPTTTRFIAQEAVAGSHARALAASPHQLAVLLEDSSVRGSPKLFVALKTLH